MSDKIDAPTAEQFATWAETLQAMIRAAYLRQWPDAPAGFLPSIMLERGPRYTRIVRFDQSSRGAYGFIDNATGDLFMAASWKAPAKHRRGNVAKGLAGCTEHGMAYLR